MEPSTIATVSTWRVRFDGPCAGCGRQLVAGTPAVWDRGARQMRCVECAGVASDIAGGTAGASARREYERRAAKRDAEIGERWGTRIGSIVKAISTEPQSIRAWATGADGEVRVAAELAKVPGIRTLHDRRVPGTRGNLDHVVVAPAGIFVIDAKRVTGRIEIRNKGWLLRSNLRLYVGGRDRTTLAEAMAWQVDAVQAALADSRIQLLPPVTPVLCFVGAEWPLISRRRDFLGVRLESERSIKRAVSEPVELEPDVIDRIAQALSRMLKPK